MTFTHCATVLSEAFGRALGGVIHKFKTLRDVGFNTFAKMYDTAVTSVSDYAAEIWGYKDFPVCNNIQNRAMRYYLGVHRFAPIVGMQGDFGWLSPRYRRFKCILNFWNRLICMSNNRLTKHVFTYDYQECYNNWSADIKRICEILNIVDVFDNFIPADKQNVIENLVKLNKQEWLENVHNKPKLRTYVLFKREFSLENYIKYHMHKRKRSLLSQFRLGILPLRIETGRYDNTPVNNRLCKLCVLNAVEDEYHFVMTCPLYVNFRLNLFQKAAQMYENFGEINDINKFKFLVEKCYKPLSQFIYDSYERRQRSLFN